jgi:hypothetical protein
MLRQVLMCNVDTGVLGQVWYLNEGKPVTFPDFNTRHKVRTAFPAGDRSGTFSGAAIVG